MKRRDLSRCAREIASETNKESYTDWVKKDYPITYEHEFEGQQVQVEIDLLETQADYLQLSVSVYDGGLSSYLPAGVSVLIHKQSNIT